MSGEQAAGATSLIRPGANEWMPPKEAYMLVAEGLHDRSELCNATYYLPFAACEMREADIEEAIAMLRDLRRAGWRVSLDPGKTLEIGL